MKLLKNAFIKSLPIMAGYIALGTGFGVLLKVSGYGVWWALIMSVTMYAGAMQYVAISLITSGATFLSTATTTLLVNARHLFYGISLIEKYKGAGLKKFYMMFALTDETYSLVCSIKVPKGIDPHSYYFLLSLFNHSYWITGCVLGNLLGGLITFDTKGIDFVMTALFVTIFIEQWTSTKEHLSALTGVCVALICLFIFGAENFLIPSMIGIIIFLSLFKKTLEKGEKING